MIQTPLLLGDSVEVQRGEFAGRSGRVAEIDTRAESAYVYFGHIRNELPDGSLQVGSEADNIPFDDLMFRGLPIRESLVGPDDRAPAPDDSGSEFLQAIRNDPANSEQRLIYADWLEERGDPHAEYLRVQVEISRAVSDGQSPEQWIDRERRLREILSPEWISVCRRLTTEPRPFDVAALDPEIEKGERKATRLHPRAGHITDPTASRIGGQFLWPADEPWPEMPFEPDEDSSYMYNDEEVPDPGTSSPLVAVLQLNATDFPSLPFPPGTDLFQLFWQPIWCHEHGPQPKVVWRDSGQVTQPLAVMPEPQFAQWGLVPTECSVYPEEITEYPDWMDHEPTEALDAAVQKWTKTFNSVSQSYPYFWSQCHGTKTGGFPWVNQSDCEWPSRDTDDGRPMDLLLTISYSEINHCHWGWCPLEDRYLCQTATQGLDDLTGGFYQFSRGNYFVFVDPNDPWTVKPYYSYLS